MKHVNQSSAQELGREGERWFLGQLPRSWIFQRPSEDIGIDGTVVIAEEGFLNGAEFKVQIKSSKKFQRRNETIILKNIKLGTLLYWVDDLVPVLLALFEKETHECYLCWVLDLFDSTSISAIYKKKQKTITLKIPITRTFSPSDWDSVRERLLFYHRSVTLLTKAFNIIQAYMPNIYVLTLAVQNLVASLATGDIVPENKKQIASIELPAHKAVMEALANLANEMESGSGSQTFLLKELSTYTSFASKIWSPLAKYIRGEIKAESLDVNTGLRKAELWNLVLRVLSLIAIASESTYEGGLTVLNVPVEPVSSFEDRFNKAIDSFLKEKTKNRGFWEIKYRETRE